MGHAEPMTSAMGKFRRFILVALMDVPRDDRTVATSVSQRNGSTIKHIGPQWPICGMYVVSYTGCMPRLVV